MSNNSLWTCGYNEALKDVQNIISKELTLLQAEEYTYDKWCGYNEALKDVQNIISIELGENK